MIKIWEFKIKTLSISSYVYSVTLLFAIYAVGVSIFGMLNFAPFFLLSLSSLILYQLRIFPALFLLGLINAYFNYSIVVGEYLGLPWLGVGNVYEKSSPLYERMIGILVIYNLGFYNIIFGQGQKTNLQPYDRNSQPVIVLACAFLLILVLIFGVDRSGNIGYSVKITPAFEYSSLLVLIGIYFSASDRRLKYLIYVLAAFFVFEDLRFGGRVTSLRILLTIYLMHSNNFVSNKKTVTFFVVGVLLMTLIGSTRGFVSTDIASIFLTFFSNFFVFDTVVFSYYASVMHLKLYENVDVFFISQSLASVLNQTLFFGIIPDGDYFQLTGKSAERGFVSLGGGVAPSFFYFWLGYGGVFVSGLAIGLIYRKLMQSKSIGSIYFVAAVAAFPRWFLYGPWILPKTLYLIFLFFILLNVIIISKRSNEIND